MLLPIGAGEAINLQKRSTWTCYASEAEQRTGQRGRIRTPEHDYISTSTNGTGCHILAGCHMLADSSLLFVAGHCHHAAPSSLLLFEPAAGVVSKSHWHSFSVGGTYPYPMLPALDALINPVAAILIPTQYSPPLS